MHGASDGALKRLKRTTIATVQRKRRRAIAVITNQSGDYTTKDTKELEEETFRKSKIFEFHLRAHRALRGFFLVYDTTKSLALASPATQSEEESKPRNTLNTRKKVEASRAT